MYRLIFEKRELDNLNKLQKQIKERIWKKLQDCKENPLKFFERLVGDKSFKLRVGDWRIIAEIDVSEQIIKILKVGHRKNIYG